MSADSVDAVVTDPPYGLSFMGKKWDYDVPSVEVWQECLRVLKPGGYLLSFAGTRTQHRMAVRIEDAGFEIRDMIAWVYGSGFPKSLNIGKAVDKLQGNERVEVGRTERGNAPSMMGKSDPNSPNYDGTTFGVGTTIHTKGTSKWEGWGTALKPALEPITVARKPLSEKSVAENCLKWGTGGINIDECRVDTTDVRHTGGQNFSAGHIPKKAEQITYTGGRFPANLIHDGSDEVVSLFPNDSQRFFYTPKASKSERNKGCEGLEEKVNTGVLGTGVGGGPMLTGSGNVRNNIQRNNHPTVKPVALMEYLIKLVSREGSTILDPFAGSGSTGIACKNLNRNYILIEKDPQYVEIINCRLA
jgi:site-specific DNA-methyltransferase (adenine-specific)